MSEEFKPCAEINVGVSHLRQMCSTTLRSLDKTLVLHDRLEPISVIIPYPAYMQYMQWQERAKELHLQYSKAIAAWNELRSDPAGKETK